MSPKFPYIHLGYSYDSKEILHLISELNFGWVNLDISNFSFLFNIALNTLNFIMKFILDLWSYKP